METFKRKRVKKDVTYGYPNHVNAITYPIQQLSGSYKESFIQVFIHLAVDLNFRKFKS